MNKKYLIIGIVLTLVLALVGITYAYWVIGIQGEGTNMNVTLDLDGASVIFTDETEIAETGVKPGWETSKTFTVENTNVIPFTYDIYIKDLINPLVDGGLQYKITSTNGYNMDDYATIDTSTTAIDFDLATSISIPSKIKQEYTIYIKYANLVDIDQSEDKGKSFSGRLMIRENTRKTLYTTLTDGVKYPTVKTRDNFDTVLGDETGTTGVIYKEEVYKEDGAPVYYFAGNSKDNWVKFAGFYWRIIRTNEDESVRLLYAGTSSDTTTGYISASTAYNITDNNTMYVGYMYGSAGSLNSNRGLDSNENYTGTLMNSTIKTTVDEWYSTNITGSNAELVDIDAIYCNDRSGDGYKSSGEMDYAAQKRLEESKRPTYRCGGNPTNTGLYSDANEMDKFTHKDSTLGNQKLTYPAGLMTADELVFAGGKYGTKASNTYYYLNSAGGPVTGSEMWWTMSPYRFNNSANIASVFRVTGSASNPGFIGGNYLSYSCRVRPVLSLKGNAIVSGSGLWNDPYEIVQN